MAEQPNDIDRLFRDKLSGQTINPSPMTWKKMEERLSKKKKTPAIWMKIAASLLLLLGLTALLWINLRWDDQARDILADKDPIPEMIQKQTPILMETPEIPIGQEDGIEKQEALPEKRKKVNNVSPKQVEKNIAQTDPQPPIKETVRIREIEPIELPPLDMDNLVAENEYPTSEVNTREEVPYKVTIISNGIKATPEKENLVGEIENKIDKIGDLLVKVDQGFADLQDAKNNLFTSITAKK